MKRKINTISDEQKMTIQLWLGVALAISGIVLMIVSFLVPPLGVIDGSVLAAIGEVFTFSGALIGIDYNYKTKHYRIQREYDEKEHYHNSHNDGEYNSEPLSVAETGENGAAHED